MKSNVVNTTTVRDIKNYVGKRNYGITYLAKLIVTAN